jgi:hypothetical protein
MSDVNAQEETNSQDRTIRHDSGPGIVGRSALEVFLHFLLTIV